MQMSKKWAWPKTHAFEKSHLYTACKYKLSTRLIVVRDNGVVFVVPVSNSKLIFSVNE